MNHLRMKRRESVAAILLYYARPPVDFPAMKETAMSGPLWDELAELALSPTEM